MVKVDKQTMLNGEKIDGFKVKVTLVSEWTQANNLLKQLWK